VIHSLNFTQLLHIETTSIVVSRVMTAKAIFESKLMSFFKKVKFS
jgi:hypothetical protein